MTGRRTAILNGFGRTFGDSLIGLQALEIACRDGAIAAPATLFRLSGFAAVIEQLYEVAGDLAEVRPLPWTAATPDVAFDAGPGFDRMIDIRDFAYDPPFRGTAMIDYFLAALGLDPASVPSSRKRNTWLLPRLAPPLAERPAHILVCPRTSTPLRDMPDEIHGFILRRLVERVRLPILTQGEVPPGITGPIARVGPAPDLPGLCDLVRRSALVVAADTGPVHLADALQRPCLAFFTTHRPQWRVRDYPLCRGVDLVPAELPAALEFYRGEQDIAAAREGWFVRGTDLDWLAAELTAALATAGIASR